MGGPAQDLLLIAYQYVQYLFVCFFLLGKQQHIESVLRQIEKDQKLRIKSGEVILLDDDQQNIKIAESCKMRALHITGDDSIDALLEQR